MSINVFPCSFSNSQLLNAWMYHWWFNQFLKRLTSFCFSLQNHCVNSFVAQPACVLISSRSIPRNLTYFYFIFSGCISLLFASCLNSLLKQGIAEISKYLKIVAHIKITILERTLSDWVGVAHTVKIFFVPLYSMLYRLYKDIYIS